MTRSCVFCGSEERPLTREHVFPAWIGREFFSDGTGTSVLINADGQTRSFPAQPFTQTLKIACNQCNNGWMSRLEVKVRPLLVEMMVGHTVRLRPPQQHILASWAVKTSLVLDHLHPSARVVPDSEYRELYQNKEPNPQHFVWLGVRSVPPGPRGQTVLIVRKQQIVNFQAESDLVNVARTLAAEGRKLYRITFGLGALVVAVFSHDFPFDMSVTMPERPVIKQIWPVTRRFKWPSTPLVDTIGGVEGLHESFRGTPESS